MNRVYETRETVYTYIPHACQESSNQHDPPIQNSRDFNRRDFSHNVTRFPSRIIVRDMRVFKTISRKKFNRMYCRYMDLYHGLREKVNELREKVNRFNGDFNDF